MSMASAKHTRPLTRSELAFLDKALLAGEVVIGLKRRNLKPEGMAHLVADYAIALVRERRLIRTKGI